MDEESPAAKSGLIFGSVLYDDFMIGSPGTRLTGIRRDGSAVPIMQNGRLLI